jgi:hypothetical protein
MTHFRTHQSRSIALLALVVSTGNVQAANNSFLALVDSSWHTVGNWSLGRVPSSTDDVLLGPFAVRHSTGTSFVNSISSAIGGSLTLSGGTVNYSANSNVFNFSQSGSSTLAGNGSFTPLNSASLSGTQTGTGTTVMGTGAGPYVVGDVRFDTGRTLRNVGTLSHNGTLFFEFMSSGTSTARFVNEGTYNISSGRQRSISNGGAITADMTVNRGTINKAGAQGFAFDTLDQRGTLNIVEGNLGVEGVGVLRSGSTSGGSGTFLVNASILTVEAGVSTSGLNLRTDFAGTVNYAGDLTVASFQQSGAGRLSGTGAFVPLNSASLTSGLQNGTGTTVVGTGAGPYVVGEVRFDTGRTLRNVGTLSHNGTLFLDFYSSSTNTASFINEGTYNISSGSQRSISSGGAITADMTANFGTINKNGTGSFTFDTLDQRGTLNVNEGNLLISRANRFAQGEVKVATGATLTLSNVNGAQSDGVTTIDGKLDAQFPLAKMVLSGGVLTGNGVIVDSAYGGVTDQVLANSGGTVAPGRQDAVGKLTINGGYSQSASGIWEVDIASLTSFDLLAVSQASVLGGSIRVDALDPNLSLTVGDRFRIGTFAAGYSGTFAGVTSTDLFNGLVASFMVVYNTNNVELVVGSLAPVPEPATWALWLVGIAAVGRIAQRSRR